jgi:aldose 1-epimerase
MKQQIFGRLSDGRQVTRYTLFRGDILMRILDWGGIITELHVGGRDVTLGYETLEPYTRRHPYFGALVGRVAGRIGGRAFTLDGTRYELAGNEKTGNHLHGGDQGFDRRIWNAEPSGDDALRLSLQSPDGDQGYPGDLDVAVLYQLQEDGLRIKFDANTTKPTPVALTNHAYFNLAGHDHGSALNHFVKIHAADYGPADEAMQLDGRRVSVERRGEDLQTPIRLADIVEDLHGSHGANYFVDGTLGELRPAAEVAAAGLRMNVATTADCLQFYTGVSLDGSDVGKGGVRYDPFAGLCFEAHPYPAAVNFANAEGIASNVLRPGEKYRQVTKYTFSAD